MSIKCFAFLKQSISSVKFIQNSKASIVDIESLKVKKILKDSLHFYPSPSPSVKIQIMGGKLAKVITKAASK